MSGPAMPSIEESNRFLQTLEQPERRRIARRSKQTNFFDGFKERAAMPNGGFHGGQIDRITEEWQPGTIGPNRMVQMNGQLLRERAWDLYLNNPFASAVIDAMIANVIECGIVPERNEAWESTWRRWGGLTPHSTKDCDLSRDQTIYGLQDTWLREVLVGGGCLTHFVTVSRRSQEVPLAIELIGEERFANHIESFGRNPKTANSVYNGIEVDAATGRTLAYHVNRFQPNDMQWDPDEALRIPADRAEYAYFKWKTKAKRGTTLLRSCLTWLWALGYYTDNELKNSDVKSTWAYMVQTAADTDIECPDLMDSSPETGTTDIYGNTITKLEGQSIFRGYPGDKIEAVGPNVPGGDSVPWIRLIQRSIAIGARVSYEEAYRDYSKGSFSSVRAAMASDRKRFRPMQMFAINHFGNPVVNRFDNAAVANFVDGFPSPSAWLSERDQAWEQQEWTTPGWESPNPKDDAIADDLRLKNGTTTYQRILGRSGGSWRKHFRQRLVEQETPGCPQVETVDYDPNEESEVTQQTRIDEGAA